MNSFRSLLRRRSARLLTGVVAASSLLVAVGGTANASVVSGAGGSASTISYCGNSRTLHMFNFKNFVYAEYPGQLVAEHTIMSDAAGWHDYGWRSAYGSTSFGTTVGSTTGSVARVYTQYAWLTAAGWKYSAGWDESIYNSVFGGGTLSGYCDI